MSEDILPKLEAPRPDSGRFLSSIVKYSKLSELFCYADVFLFVSLSSFEGLTAILLRFSAFASRKLLIIKLVDRDIAGSGAGTDSWAASVDGSGDVMTVEVALHADGLLDVDAAGACISV